MINFMVCNGEIGREDSHDTRSFIRPCKPQLSEAGVEDVPCFPGEPVINGFQVHVSTLEIRQYGNKQLEG